MLLKGTKAYSVLHSKCPRCNEGDFFVTNNPYDLKKFDKMYKECAVCSQSFEMETGFYYGAMYVSYGLSVAFGIALFLLLSVAGGVSFDHFFITISIMLIVMIPLIYRTSRLIWINIFVKYKANAKDEVPSRNNRQPAISKF